MFVRTKLKKNPEPNKLKIFGREWKCPRPTHMNLAFADGGDESRRHGGEFLERVDEDGVLAVRLARDGVDLVQVRQADADGEHVDPFVLHK